MLVYRSVTSSILILQKFRASFPRLFAGLQLYTLWNLTSTGVEIWESYPLSKSHEIQYWLDIPLLAGFTLGNKKRNIVLCQFLFFVGIPISPPTPKNEKKSPSIQPPPNMSVFVGLCFAMRNSDPGWGGFTFKLQISFNLWMHKMCSKILPYPSNFQ